MATDDRPVSVAVRRIYVSPAAACDACEQPVTELLTFQLDDQVYMVCEPCMKQHAVRMPIPEGGRA